ncbi:hypothetical protein P20495_1007 [Pseudoalteromonas sp. BSi20495]|nr:hypothetical protein P20495_1007 [Pseudoalteromonas sp. BSi20495]
MRLTKLDSRLTKLDSHFNLTSKAVLLDLLFRSMISALRLR